tara:strand:- start:404 stop:1336 length:933 start_codon:yes stop_codon:yes gene_type:complete
MPIIQHLGTAFASGGGPPGESQNSPITDYTKATEWNNNTGGDTLAWIQKSGINGGAALQVYCQVSNGYLWGAAARFAGGDSTASNASGGRYRWCSCKNPNANDNDWGMATHTFNPQFVKFAGNESARTRLWFEADCNRTRLLLTGVDYGNPIEYTMTTTQKWGQRMEGESDYYRNDQGVTTGDKLGTFDSSATGTPSDDWKAIGRQVSDGEATSATSNDVGMIVICEENKWDNNDWSNMNCIGWKRSGVSGQWPRRGDNSADPTFWTEDNVANGNNCPGDGMAVIAENCNNGDMRNQPDGEIVLMVNLFN